MLTEYFILEQDPYYKTGIQFPINQYYKYSKRIQRADYSGLADFDVILLEPSNFHLYPDVLSKQVFMVSQDILDAILIFDSKMDYSTRYLMDRKNRELNTYFIPHLQAVHCLSESEDITTKCNTIKLDITKIPQSNHIFQIGDIDENAIVVSLALLEAVLRRKPKMISYTRIKSNEVKS